MSLSFKQKIQKLDEAAELLDEMVQDTDKLLPTESKHIIDRLNITVEELKSMTECLRQKGLLDEELVEVLEAA